MNMVDSRPLPLFWTWAKLRDICEAIRGVTFASSAASNEPFESSIACLTTSAVQGDVDWTTRRYIPRSSVKQDKQRVQPGDILVSTANSKPLVGKSCLVEYVPYESTFGAFLTLLRPGKLCLPYYLAAWLRSPTPLRYFFYYSSNTTNISNLRSSDLLSLDIPLPPIAEQRRIAAFLREADELRRLRRQADTRARDLLPALFEEMFGDINQAKMRWKTVAVETAGQVQLGRQRAPQYQTGQFTRPYLRVANVFEDRIDTTDVLSMDFNQVDFEKYRLVYGDILLNEGQSLELVGRPAMWRDEISDCCFQNTLIRFRANKKLTNAEYALAVFLIYFRTGRFAAVGSQTSNVAHLGAARFAKMSFPLPPLQMQEEFAARVAELRQSDSTRLSSEDSLEELFNSILARSFTGELTAAWREVHDEQLREEVVQRDIALGIRGTEPTIGDLEAGRVTRAEQDEANRQLAHALEQFRSIPSTAFQGLFAEAFGDLAKIDVTSLLGSNAEAIEGMSAELSELSAAQMGPVSRKLVERLSGLTRNLLELHVGALQQPMLQPAPELARQLAAWFSSMGRLGAVTEMLDARKALRESLTEELAELLSKIASGPAYFRPEILADGQISLLQVEERLHLLIVLGLVRPVTVRGQASYRLISIEREQAVPGGLGL